MTIPIISDALSFIGDGFSNLGSLDLGLSLPDFSSFSGGGNILGSLFSGLNSATSGLGSDIYNAALAPSGFGALLTAGSGLATGLLAQSQQRKQLKQQQAEAQRSRDFTAGENQIGREFSAEQAQLTREFNERMAAEARDFQAEQALMARRMSMVNQARGAMNAALMNRGNEAVGQNAALAALIGRIETAIT